MKPTPVFAALLIPFASCVTTIGVPTVQDSMQDTASAPTAGDDAKSFMHPVSQPVTFETPSVDTSLRPVFMHHEFPNSSVFQGGDLQLYALQARYAVNDKLGIIATKDGYIDLNPGVGALEDEGFADIAAGVKYEFYEDKERGILATGGLIIEADTGDHEVFQGNGDGLVRPFVSAGYTVEDVNLIGSLGFNLPFHGARESHSIDYHLHADYAVTEQFSPLVEFHGISYTRSGNNTALAGFEGGDLINLGAANVAGQNVFMGAVGGRFQAHERVSLGAAYEFPLGGRDDVLDWRITVDAVITF